jgi:hypothetical protein
MVQPVIPEVRCKQKPGKAVPALPRDDEWVEWAPPAPGEKTGMARLSEKAVNWITETLGVVREEKGLRKIEHECLDNAEKKKLIQQ